MENYRAYVLNFISELQESFDIEKCSFENGICSFVIKRWTLFIYLPNTSRVHVPLDVHAIHIDVDQILTSSTKIINRIRGMLGLGQRIYARNTVVARIDKKEAMAFQEDHHLQVPLPGKYRYGLFYQGDLVSIAIFSGGRRMRDQHEDYRSFELLRFCHKADYLVVGGLSKLLKSFTKEFLPQDIMTYADLDWTQESSLQTIAFKIYDHIPPQQFYIVENIRQSNLPDVDQDYYLVNNTGSLKLKLIL